MQSSSIAIGQLACDADNELVLDGHNIAAKFAVFV